MTSPTPRTRRFARSEYPIPRISSINESVTPMRENEVIDQMRADMDLRQNIENRKALKLSTKRKQRLVHQGASVQQIIDSTIKPSLTKTGVIHRGSEFEHAIRNHK